MNKCAALVLFALAASCATPSAFERYLDAEQVDATDDEALAAALGKWARERLATERVETLTKLIAHKTFHEANNDPPGSSPAFAALEADLVAFSRAHGLDFSTVDHLAHALTTKSGAQKGNENLIGVLVHADVVPAAEPGWTSDPFAATLRDGKLYGRGALDDKGAMVAVMYALSAIEAAGLKSDRAPILVVGTSEETHWTGIEAFVKTRGAPRDVFVADGSFPLSVGEKGVVTARVGVEDATTPPAAGALILDVLEGGQVANQVPATARAVLSGSAPALKALAASDHASITTRFVDDGHLEVVASGKAAHGAVPAEGDNAIQRLLRFILAHAELRQTDCVELMKLLDETLDGTHDAAHLGLTSSHPRFSPATVNLGTFNKIDGRCEAALNIRWPPPSSSKAVLATVEATLKRRAPDLKLTVKGGGLDPFIKGGEEAITRALKSAYTGVFGEAADEVTLSGTTYAKTIPGGALTFGPSKPGAHDARIHGPNEFISVTELGELVEVYTRALVLLMRR